MNTPTSRTDSPGSLPMGDQPHGGWKKALEKMNLDLTHWTPSHSDQVSREAERTYYGTLMSRKSATDGDGTSSGFPIIIKLLASLKQGHNLIQLNTYGHSHRIDTDCLNHAEVLAQLRTEGYIPDCQCNISLVQLFSFDSGLEIGRVFRGPPCDHFIHIETNMDIAFKDNKETRSGFDDDLTNPYLLNSPATKNAIRFGTELRCRSLMSAELTDEDAEKTATGLINYVNRIRRLQHAACVA